MKRALGSERILRTAIDKEQPDTTVNVGSEQSPSHCREDEQVSD